MKLSLKKIIGYVLVLMVLISTVVAILGVWGIINLEDLFSKVFSTLLIIFVASAVFLFIFSIILKDDTPHNG